MTPSRLNLGALVGLLINFVAVAAVAQEGFPLDGTWRGEWEAAGGDRTTVVIVMKWDGEKIAGTINPGRNSAPFTAAVLDPSDWTVHFEAQVPGRSGEPVPVVIEGKLENIGSYQRTITGTWNADGVPHPFSIRRE